MRKRFDLSERLDWRRLLARARSSASARFAHRTQLMRVGLAVMFAVSPVGWVRV